MAETAHSSNYEICKKRYQDEKSISEEMLRRYVKVKRITAEEFEEITGVKY